MTSDTLEVGRSSDMAFQRLCSDLRSRIALVFIQKNEGGLAIEMLRSVVPIVGFVAFVDTGSEDGSKAEIGRCLSSAGVPFASKSMRSGRFDAMRNASLELVPEEFEWILVMDADELLLSKDFGAIKALMERPDVDAWLIPRFNWIDRMWGEHQPALKTGCNQARRRRQPLTPTACTSTMSSSSGKRQSAYMRQMISTAI